MNGIHRAGIDASSAVDAGIGIDGTLVTRFTNGVNRAGIVAGAAVNALFGNRVGQDIHLLRNGFFGIQCGFSRYHKTFGMSSVKVFICRGTRSGQFGVYDYHTVIASGE